jgi:hypothetical protein
LKLWSSQNKEEKNQNNSKKFKFTSFVDNFGGFLTESTNAAEKKESILTNKAIGFYEAGTRVFNKLEICLDHYLKQTEK